MVHASVDLPVNDFWCTSMYCHKQLPPLILFPTMISYRNSSLPPALYPPPPHCPSWRSSRLLGVGVSPAICCSSSPPAAPPVSPILVLHGSNDSQIVKSFPGPATYFSSHLRLAKSPSTVFLNRPRTRCLPQLCLNRNNAARSFQRLSSRLFSTC